MHHSSPTAPSSPDSLDRTLDSPSRQLLRELKLLNLLERQSFHDRLDEKDRRLSREHSAGLAAVAAKREERRRNAEEALRQWHADDERRRKQEEERRKWEEKLEWERKEKLEAEKKRREEERAKAEAAAKKAAEEKARAEALERERQEAKRKQEEQARQKEAERIAQEKAAKEKANAEREQEKAESKAEVASQPVSSIKNAEQKRYVEIHKHLKQFRASMTKESKTNPALKGVMGEMRRNMRMYFNTLTDVKEQNKAPQEKITRLLLEAVKVQGPTVDMREFMAFPPSELANSPQTPLGHALLIYLLNIFSKCAISKFTGEAAVSTRTADHVGILVALIFSKPEFKYNSKFSLIDILLAKFRVVCPVLFGIYGDEKTPTGKARTGWMARNGQFIPETQHLDRMTGLGAGFAAIALRNFDNNRQPNPFPNANYWRAVSYVVNVPTKDIMNTHYVLLKSMIDGQEEKVLHFFGNAGLALLRKALVEFPARAPEQTAGSRALALLGEILAKDKNFHLS